MNKKQAYQIYLQSSDWKLKQAIALRLAKYRCIECNTTKCVEVHHRKYGDWYNADPKKDLVVVCRKCHQDVHDHKGYVFNPKRRKKPKNKKRELSIQEKVELQERIASQQNKIDPRSRYDRYFPHSNRISR